MFNWNGPTAIFFNRLIWLLQEFKVVILFSLVKIINEMSLIMESVITEITVTITINLQY